MRAVLTLVLLLLSVNVYAVESFPAPGRKDAKVYVPQQYSKDKAWPVVVLLHGYFGNDSEINSYFGFSDEVSKRGFILIVPNGKNDSGGVQYWNATDGCCDFDHAGSDDVGYIVSLVKEVGAKYNLDMTRIFAAGHSNGGFMSHRLACETDSPFSAIVSLAGVTWQDTAKCKPSHPISILQIHALNDETIKYDGDPVGYQKLAPYPGAVFTINSWLALNHCGSAASDGPVKHITANNETKTQSWQGCANGARVELWTIQGPKTFSGSGHIPVLTKEFTQSTLDFLLGTQLVTH